MLNLRDRRQELGLTMLEVAQAIGVSEAAISRYESGSIKNMRRDRIVKYAQVLKVDPIEFLGLDDPAPPEPNARFLDKDHIFMIPVYESVSAGFGTYADDRVIAYEPIYLSCGREAQETLAINVKGDSMYPKIEEGDLVVVHKQDYFENGDIVVAVVVGADEGFVKRAFQTGGKLSLESINPSYPPLTFVGSQLDEVKIMGVVRKIIKTV
ncbi:MAG: helix-turn-helix domain-containing protein [Ruminococcus sp.]|nr:helix-turn-helix domain-containing protein [Ruminococcus sp.]